MKAIFVIALLSLMQLAQASERQPGGATTHNKAPDKFAFSHAAANMTLERQLDFKLGQSLFERLWVSSPSSTQAADGLGPLYNARSCQRCHLNGGRGRAPVDANEEAVSLLLRLSVTAPDGTAQPEPTYGKQLQTFAIRGQHAEGKLKIEYDEIEIKLADGEIVQLRRPSYVISDLAYGPLQPQTQISPRIAPAMIGLGLLEAIDENHILALTDPDDKNGDGISGKANRVWSRERNAYMLGRFGWKAGIATVNEQSQAAFANDIGISTPLYPAGAGDCTEKQTTCRAAPDGNSPQYDNLEAHQTITDLVAHYSRNLGLPPRRIDADENVMAGKKLFHDSGCAKCHTPTFTTRSDTHAEQAQQQIWPYTDLLLHDMGDGLADHFNEAEANGREWRTPPLWGIGLTPIVSGHTFYLHDGRARNLLEAILWHGGEAQPARDAVLNMNKEQRANLLEFIHSL